VVECLFYEVEGVAVGCGRTPEDFVCFSQPLGTGPIPIATGLGAYFYARRSHCEGFAKVGAPTEGHGLSRLQTTLRRVAKSILRTP
jgi:hypothetical protein